MAPAAFSNHMHDHLESKTLCVMDASGEVGSTLVYRLLLRGYTVHAAVQDHGELLKKLLKGKNNEKKRLKVFNTDPLDYHSIMDALKGCCGLFYSFEAPSDYPIYDENMADIEVRAAHNVLEACARTYTIDKIVFTSSVTSVIWKDAHLNSSVDNIDERNWSDPNFCRKFKLWHALSKTLAEKTAWALAMDRDLNMVTINGGLVMSPSLTIKTPYLKGAAEMYKSGVFVTSELNSLADSHICVFEDVSSYGRYICFNNVIHCNEEALKLAFMVLPSSQSSPSLSLEEETKVYEQRISNEKLNKLMVDFE